MKTLVSSSLLAADFTNLKDEIKRTENSKADMLHLDIMDGIFVTNLSFGVPVVAQLRKLTDIIFDTHLMTQDPIRLIEKFAKAGSDYITFHIESDSNISDTIKLIKSFGVKVGLSVKPKTPVEEVYKYLDELDLVLIMTVEPGYGGQSFMEDMLPKITKLKDEIKKRNLNTIIEIDGGVNDKTGKLCVQNGADALVAGTYLYASEDMQNRVKILQNL